MRRISSVLTWYYKSGYNAFSFGALGVFILTAAVRLAMHQDPPAFLLIGLGLFAINCLVVRFTIFPLADEVFLDGGYIIVRNQGKRARFPVSNVAKIRGWEILRPEQITLILNEACPLGREITFMAPIRASRWGKHPVFEELKLQMLAQKSFRDENTTGPAK